MKTLFSSCYRTPASTVAGSFLVMVVGLGPIAFVAFSLFMPAIAEDFGWSRSTLSLGVLILTASSALTMPLLGRLIDRFGIRKPTTLAVVLFCTVMAAAAFMPQSIVVFFLIYALLGLLGASLTPMPYTKAVSALFDRRRGLALGIAMSGYGIGAALVSLFVPLLISHFGWRNAYWMLALAVLVVALFSLWLFIVDSGKQSGNDKPSLAPQTGLSVKEALTDSANFWLIAIALLLISIPINGLVTHLISLATDRGLSASAAGYLLTALGISSIIGRLVTGYLIDRFFAPRIAIIVFILPLLGIVLLALPVANNLLLLSAIALGIGLGAEVDLMGYVVGRYFGITSFAEIYGYLLATFSIGAGVGAYFFGSMYDHYHSYEGALWLAAGAMLVAIMLFQRLGEYRFPSQ